MAVSYSSSSPWVLVSRLTQHDGTSAAAAAAASAVAAKMVLDSIFDFLFVNISE